MPGSESRYEYSIIEFAESLKASFIGTGKPADERYSPRILVNDKEAATDVLSVLKGELSDCESFDFSVAFVTSSGIQALVEMLNMLKRRNVPGRILTSTYLDFNDPDALRKLLDFPNIETRVYEGDLHAKGYFFNRSTLSTFIIGSSNLTQKALTCNKEWNVMFRSLSEGEILSQVRREFDGLWRDCLASTLTPEWLSRYEGYLQSRMPRGDRSPKRCSTFKSDCQNAVDTSDSGVTPNEMQRGALAALSRLRAKGEERALLVSATGTGKTYLAALDVRAARPRRVLFVAHRKRILAASMESFEHVLGDAYSFGVYGEDDVPDKTCVFAMVGSLSRHVDDFDPFEFDYIVIDEAHRTGADSYRKLLAYFRPAFFLGMTATPSRTDGYDVYGLFNHVVAYRITLQNALESDMLAPFHYFGIADLEIDGESKNDPAAFALLTSRDRVKHIIDKIEEYTVDKGMRRGLIFCSKNDEAAKLSEMLNDAGYRTRAISGETPDIERDLAIADLEAGSLEYILSVDILNEGIDIPSLNQVIMLRPTESPVVFMQQLGRGLRKCSGKEYVLVLDFIGNYQQNFMIPMALSGDRTYNKDTLRRVVKEGSVGIPGCSTISFDSVSEKRIFKALEDGRFGDAKLIRGEYQHLKQMLGRIPRLVDFDPNEAIDPMIIRKHGSYAAFLQRVERDLPYVLTERQLSFLKFLSTKLAAGKRHADLFVLWRLVEDAVPLHADDALPHSHSLEVRSVASVLSGEYSSRGEEVAVYAEGSFSLSAGFVAELENSHFRDAVLDVLKFGLSRNERGYRTLYKDTGFVLYRKYTREEICRLLCWEKEPNFQNIGGYFYDKKTNTFPVFIDYEKDPTISVTTQYEDRFTSESRLVAVSKSKRTLASPEIMRLKGVKENGMRCFLFMRKNKNDRDEGKEFYFLGEMHPTGVFREITMADHVTKAVEIGYELEDAVRGDLYDYLTSNLDA